MQNGGSEGPFQGRSRRCSPGSERTAQSKKKILVLKCKKKDNFFFFFSEFFNDVAVAVPRHAATATEFPGLGRGWELTALLGNSQPFRRAEKHLMNDIFGLIPKNIDKFLMVPLRGMT